MKLMESKFFTDKNTTQEITTKQLMPSNISIKTVQVLVLLPPALFSWPCMLVFSPPVSKQY